MEGRTYFYLHIAMAGCLKKWRINNSIILKIMRQISQFVTQNWNDAAAAAALIFIPTGD